MNYISISSRRIISNVFRNFGMSDSNWVGDAVEWIGEAMQGIGYHAGFERKIACIKIENHRGCYPCDLVALLGVSYNGCKLPLGADISGYGIVDRDNTSVPIYKNDGEDTQLVELYDRQKELYDDAVDRGDSENAALYLEAMNRTAMQIAGMWYSKPQDYRQLPDYYNAEPDYIKTSFDCGIVRIAYIAYPVDKEGFPKIPDEFNYKKAVEYYIIWMSIQRNNKHPVLDYATALTLWEKYRDKASSRAKQPSIDRMERFMKMWTRIRFDQNLSKNFFVGGEEEFIAK